MNALESKQYKSFLKALDNFDAKHRAGAKMKMTAPVNLCATYKSVKPILEGILPFLAFLPGVGARIVTAIRALMAALDTFCPTA